MQQTATHAVKCTTEKLSPFVCLRLDSEKLWTSHRHYYCIILQRHYVFPSRFTYHTFYQLEPLHVSFTLHTRPCFGSSCFGRSFAPYEYIPAQSAQTCRRASRVGITDPYRGAFDAPFEPVFDSIVPIIVCICLASTVMELRTERVSRCRFFKLIFLDPFPFIIMRCRPCEKFEWGQRKTFRNRKVLTQYADMLHLMMCHRHSPCRSRRKSGRLEFSEYDCLTSCFLPNANVTIATRMRAIELEPCMVKRRCFL
jgi:hypothetical protein